MIHIPILNIVLASKKEILASKKEIADLSDKYNEAERLLTRWNVRHKELVLIKKKRNRLNIS